MAPYKTRLKPKRTERPLFKNTHGPAAMAAIAAILTRVFKPAASEILIDGEINSLPRDQSIELDKSFLEDIKTELPIALFA
jgi:hypothetical protein